MYKIIDEGVIGGVLHTKRRIKQDGPAVYQTFIYPLSNLIEVMSGDKDVQITLSMPVSNKEQSKILAQHLCNYMLSNKFMDDWHEGPADSGTSVSALEVSE